MGLEGAQAPTSLKMVCLVIRQDPTILFIMGGTCTCTIMNTSVILLQPYQTHPNQTTSVPVFQSSQPMAPSHNRQCRAKPSSVFVCFIVLVSFFDIIISTSSFS